MLTLTSRSIRAWGWIHKWTSLISTLFILMLCITGLPLIFAHEIEHAMMPELEHVSEDNVSPSIDSIVAKAEASRPDEELLYLFFDEEEPLMFATTAPNKMAAPDDFYYQVYDLRTGNKIDMPQPNEGIMYIITKLHVDMFAGLPGMLFLGTMALLMLIAIISGVVLYTPFMRRVEFGEMRQGKNIRTRWLDLHNLLGIVTVVWLFVVGLTGAINTLATPIERMWQATELSEMASSYKDLPVPNEFVSYETVIKTIKNVRPDLTLMTIAMPSTPFASPHHFGLYMVGNTALTSRLLTPALVDAKTGELSAIREMPAYVKTLFLSQPLHFGDYGGMPLKIIWTVLDLLTIVVLISGLYLWLARRKTKSKANDYSDLLTSNV